MAIRVAVLDDYQRVAEQCADWQVLGAETDVVFFHDHLESCAKLVARLDQFDVICLMRERTPATRELLEQLPQLRLLVTSGRRNATIDVAAASALGITVCGTNSPGHATAELAMGLILSLARNLQTEVRSVSSGRWQVGLGRDLRGATLGLIGLGRLGAQVAGFGTSFGMEVISWSENLTKDRCAEVGVRRVSKDDLLREADFISIHLRLSDRTKKLVGEREIGLMKTDAYLVNTSRGPIVDTAALVEALRRRELGGAALDVFDEEPLPADDPMRSVPNLMLTPHIGYVTRETYEVFYGGTVAAIGAWIQGHPINLIEP